VLVDRAIALALDPGVCGVRVVRLDGTPQVWTPVVFTALETRLTHDGFVWIRPDDGVNGQRRRGSRHVAMLVVSDAERHAAASWVRALEVVTPRGHVVFDLRHSRHRDPCAGFVTPSVTVEAAPASVAWKSAQLARALAAMRRHRPGEATRWFAAALASAARRACPQSFSTIVEQWTDQALCTARMVEDDRLIRVLANGMDAGTRACALARLATVQIARGAFAHAEALLAETSAASVLLDAPVPVATRWTLAELRFWQGRFEEAAALAGTVPSGGEAGHELAAALIAWATCDDERLNSLAATTRERSVEDRLTALAVRSLDAMRSRRPRVVVDLAHRFEQLVSSCRDSSRHLERRLRAVLSETLRMVGSQQAAAAILGPSALWADAPPLDGLLAGAIRRNAAPVGERSVWHERIERIGAFGVTKWVGDRTSMQLLHAIPEVLRLIHEAEDEYAGLVSACAWLRRHSGAVVGILDVHGVRVLAAAGWRHGDRLVQRDMAESGVVAVTHDDGVATMSAQVRYGGVHIGFVVARGPSRRQEAMREGVQAMAALCAPGVRARLDATEAQVGRVATVPELVGLSPALTAVREAVGRAASTPFAVLIEGESGTGKELVARAVHRLSARRDRRLVVLNCAALTDELAEAELFGHARGAFTGAVAARPGLFEEAHGGTLFLDEVRELSARTQAKLLRALQEREIRRVGENLTRPADVRVIAATNRPLAACVASGHFREDLLFRLAVIRISLPPLRNRPEDVGLLARAFWRDAMKSAGKGAILTPQAVAVLAGHAWPGNVRELQNVIAGLAVIAPRRGRVLSTHVSQVLVEATHAAAGPALPLEVVREHCERQTIVAALSRCEGRKAKAARELGLTRQGLAKAIQRLGLVDRSDARGVA
jgi:DNA-binding NtrC family response regulator